MIEKVGRVNVMVVGDVQILRGLSPTGITRITPRKQMHRCIAPRHADGHQVGVELALSAKRLVKEVDDEPEQLQYFPQTPEGGPDDIRGPGNANVQFGPAHDESVEPVLAMDDMVNDHRHRLKIETDFCPLSEMAKFVSQHRLELGQVDAIDQSQTDERLLRVGRIKFRIDEDSGIAAAFTW